MRVKTLIAELQAMDPDVDVLVHARDDDGVFRFLDIEAVELASAARSRRPDGAPQVLLDDSNGSPVVLLSLTSDY